MTKTQHSRILHAPYDRKMANCPLGRVASEIWLFTQIGKIQVQIIPVCAWLGFGALPSHKALGDLWVEIVITQ